MSDNVWGKPDTEHHDYGRDYRVKRLDGSAHWDVCDDDGALTLRWFSPWCEFTLDRHDTAALRALLAYADSERKELAKVRAAKDARHRKERIASIRAELAALEAPSPAVGDGKEEG